MQSLWNGKLFRQGNRCLTHYIKLSSNATRRHVNNAENENEPEQAVKNTENYQKHMSPIKIIQRIIRLQ